MKPPILNINENPDQVFYTTAMEVLEQLKNEFDLPYISKFSFQPLIRQLQKRVNESKCDVTASMIPGIEELEAQIERQNGNLSEELKQKIEEITSLLLPAMFFNDEYSFISAPFKKDIIYATPKMLELFNGNEWEVKLDTNQISQKKFGLIQKAAAAILNKFYNQNLDVAYGEFMTFRHKKSGLEKHFKLRIRHNYVDIKTSSNEFEEINKKGVNEIINNLYSGEELLKALPADKFSFTGFGIVSFEDVTEMKVISNIKDAAINTSNIGPDEFRKLLKKELQDFFGKTNLEIGFADAHYVEFYPSKSYSLTGFNNFKLHCKECKKQENRDAYQKVLLQNETLIFNDLKSIKNPSKIEKALIENGFVSLLLIPMLDFNQQPNSILEIACKTSHAFNILDIQKLEPVIELLNIGNEKFLQEINNKIDKFIKNKFTSIHPSVEWKFIEVAEKYELRRKFDAAENEIEPIVFKDVFPLYGQADIVNSSEIRNRAIQQDLILNLELIEAVIQSYTNQIDFNLLEAYLIKVQETLEILREGYTSSLESYVIDLLMKEVHPLLKQITTQYSTVSSDELDEYFSKLDSEIGIVYHQRQDYEHSVAKLNATIGNFLETEDNKLQDILPHYFEKYRTDGIEYNMYIGQSLLQNEAFSEFHLKDFKLWQLINMCEITRLVDSLEGKLPIPLQTAQLIFVYNSALSIRFRMDEKQFDVDGTYNVRYEILKKRIDKAYIKGTDERLSQSGKVSIVYLLEKDKNEYLDYLQFLIKKGYIDSNIEDLEIEKLQGADGLKALRVTVL